MISALDAKVTSVHAMQQDIRGDINGLYNRIETLEQKIEGLEKRTELVEYGQQLYRRLEREAYAQPGEPAKMPARGPTGQKAIEYDQDWMMNFSRH